MTTRKSEALKFMEEDELNKFLDTAYKDNNVYGLIFEIIVSGGLRVSESLNIKVSSLDFRNNQIYIQTLKKKGHPSEPIRYPISVMEKIKLYLKYREPKRSPDTILFPVSRVSVWKRMKKVCKLAGINTYHSPHSLRHTHGTLVSHLTHGNRDIVRRRLRHSKSETADIYVHMTDNDQDEICNYFEEMRRHNKK